jgi:hypothetical protein
VKIKEERMKKFLFSGIILLLMVGLGLLGWSIKLPDKIQETYHIQQDLSNFSNVINCPVFEDLVGSEILLDYPKLINYQESGDFSITINKSTNPLIGNLENNTSSTCGLALEVWIDVRDAIVEPGSRSFETYLNAQSQNFYFLITPSVNPPEKGTIWIFALINTGNNKTADRIPLFAIPFIVRIKSFFGIPPKIIKDFSLFLIAVTLLSLILLKNFK